MTAKGSITDPSTDYPSTVTEINDEVVDLARRAPMVLTDNSSTANSIIAQSQYSGRDDGGISVLATGMVFWWTPPIENDGAVDFQIDAMASPVNVKANDGSDIAAGYFKVGTRHLLFFDGTNIVETDVGSSVIAGNRAPDAVFQEQQSAGIDAGGSTAATFSNRVLNTTIRNNRSDISLDAATGLVTVGPGNFMTRFKAGQFGSGTFKAQLWNETDSSEAGAGSSQDSSTATQAYSEGIAFLQLSATKTFRVRTKPTSTKATTGLGKAANLGITEIYSQLEITAIDETAEDDDAVELPGATSEYFEYDDVDNIASNPGSGKIKSDNPDLTATANWYVSSLNGDLADITAFLNAIAAGTSASQGILRVSLLSDHKQYARYSVGVIVDNTGWFTVPVTYLDGVATAFDDAAALLFQLEPSGDAGTGNNTMAEGTPTALAADANDWDVLAAGRVVINVSTSGSNNYTINGIVKKATNERIIIRNVDATNTVSLANEAAGSTAANRITTGISAPLVLSPGESATLLYDATTSRWVIINPATVVAKQLAGRQGRTAVGDADYTILATDIVVARNVALTASRTDTLPLASTFPAGKPLTWVDEVGAITSLLTATITTSGSDTLNGGTALVVSNAYAQITLYSDGISKWSSTFPLAPAPNLVDNPSYNIWQRGTSFALASTTKTVVADRWKAFRGATGSTVSRQTGFNGSKYCLRLARDSGNSSASALRLWHQLHESVARGLAGRTVVLSFGIRAGANYSGGALSVGIHTGTAGSEAADLSLTTASAFATGGALTTVSSTVTPTTTAQRVVCTALLLGSSIADLALRVSWTPSGTAGAADYIEITNVKLAACAVDTPFVAPVAAADFLACQYTYRLIGYGLPVAVESATTIVLGGWGPVTQQMAGYQQQVTLLITNPAVRVNAATKTGSSSALTQTVSGGIYYTINGFSGLTAGQAGIMMTDAVLSLDGELL